MNKAPIALQSTLAIGSQLIASLAARRAAVYLIKVSSLRVQMGLSTARVEREPTRTSHWWKGEMSVESTKKSRGKVIRSLPLLSPRVLGLAETGTGAGN